MNRLERIRSRVEEKHQLIPRIDVEDLVKVVEATLRYRKLQRLLAESPVRITPTDLDQARDGLDSSLQPLLEEEEE